MTTDIVVFRIGIDGLEVLLIERGGEPFRGAWALPGGFLEPEEALEGCAERELAEETGLTGLRLEQLHAFGRPDRDPRERVVSVTYLALVPQGGCTVRAGDDATKAAWFPLTGLPELAFDHAEVLAVAEQRLREAARRDASSVLELLPDPFTMADLRHAFEALLHAREGAQGFQQWTQGLPQLVETDQWRIGADDGPMRLYRARRL